MKPEKVKYWTLPDYQITSHNQKYPYVTGKDDYQDILSTFDSLLDALIEPENEKGSDSKLHEEKR